MSPRRRQCRRRLEPGLALELPRDLGLEGREVIEDLLRLVAAGRGRTGRARAGTSRRGSSAAAWCSSSSGATASSSRCGRDQRQREPVVRAVVVRVVRRSPALERGDRAVVVVQLLQQEAAVELRLGIVGLHRERRGRTSPARRACARPARAGSRATRAPACRRGRAPASAGTRRSPRRGAGTAATTRPSGRRTQRRRRCASDAIVSDPAGTGATGSPRADAGVGDREHHPDVADREQRQRRPAAGAGRRRTSA